MRDDERNEAVAAHLRALDEELERLRRLGEGLDRRAARTDEELAVLRQLERLRADGGERPDDDPR
jgi:hypothetical protein